MTYLLTAEVYEESKKISGCGNLEGRNFVCKRQLIADNEELTAKFFAKS